MVATLQCFVALIFELSIALDPRNQATVAVRTGLLADYKIHAITRLTGNQRVPQACSFCRPFD
jgi:hypothetical protein